MDLQNEKCVMVIDENLPLGIIEFPVPILKGNADIIKAIREKLYDPNFSDLIGNQTAPTPGTERRHRHKTHPAGIRCTLLPCRQSGEYGSNGSGNIRILQN